MKKSLKNLLIGIEIIFFFSILNFKLLAKSQTDTSLNLKSIQAVKVEKGPKIDGILKDKVWQEAAVVTGFRQTNPKEGEPVSEKTQVRVLYDDKNIYFGFECFDSEPAKIVKRLTERDAFSSADDVSVLLATFDDNRNAYVFSVNASGVQTDSILSSFGGAPGRGGYRHWAGDRSWDAVWNSKIRVNDKGWFAEMAIPFRVLRFSSDREQIWGINFSRTIRRKNETASWTSYQRDFGFTRIDRAGKLVGLKNIKPGHGLEILPYAMASKERIISGEEEQNFFDKEAGLDLKYSLTPNLTLDATLNPDFGQVESDIERIDVSRYEKFFPEKRPFFLEGANIFSTPVQLFYSRRIGKKFSDGSIANILGGLKWTGKMNGFELGLIDALTKKKEYSLDGESEVEPFANYSVFRLKKDVLERSTIGFILTNKDFKDDSIFSYSRAVGIDMNFNWSNYYNAVFMLAKSFSPRVNDNDYALIAGISRSTDKFFIGFSGQGYGRNFNINEMGFLPRNDLISFGLRTNYKPRPEKFGIRQMSFGPQFMIGYDTRGVYQFGQLGTNLDFTFDFPENLWGWGYWRLGLNYDFSQEYYEDVENSSGEWKIYNYKSLSGSFSTDYNKKVFLRLSTSIKDFLDYEDKYFGKNKNLNLSLNVVPLSNLSLNLGINNSYEYYGNGILDDIKRLVVVRLHYSWTKKLFLKLLAQRRIGKIEDHSINALIGYYLNAKSIVYLAYNSSKNTSAGLDDNVLFLKFSYLFNF